MVTGKLSYSWAYLTGLPANLVLFCEKKLEHLFVCVCGIWVHFGAWVEVRGQLTGVSSLLSVWLLGTGRSLPGTAAGTFMHWVISVVWLLSFYIDLLLFCVRVCTCMAQCTCGCQRMSCGISSLSNMLVLRMALTLSGLAASASLSTDLSQQPLPHLIFCLFTAYVVARNTAYKLVSDY